jgi:putative ABC transport system substrate-binding protein
VLMNPDNSMSRLRLPLELPLAPQFGFQVDVIEARTQEDIPAAIAKAKQLGADALLSVGDPILNTPPNIIPDLAIQAALPSIYQTREVVQAGGLISYGPDFLGVARRHAHYVDRILQGASPSDLPIEQPTKYELIINLKTAKALGLTVPPSLLSQADEVIE